MKSLLSEVTEMMAQLDKMERERVQCGPSNEDIYRQNVVLLYVVVMVPLSLSPPSQCVHI